MFRIRPLLLALLAAMSFLPGFALAKKTDTQFRPLTEKEQQTLVPFLCKVVPRPTTDYMPDTYACSNFTDNTGDPPGYLTFTSIAYGSFSKPHANEAAVMFRATGGGEVGRGLSGALFAREKGSWKLLDHAETTLLGGCITIPSRGRPQRMLCVDSPMWCCGQHSETVNLVTWEQSSLHAKTLIHASGGRIDEPKDYCQHMTDGKPHLTGISDLEPSTKAGVYAEALLTYLTADAISKACAENKPDTTPFAEDRIRFVPDGDTVKTVLPVSLEGYDFTSAPAPHRHGATP